MQSHENQNKEEAKSQSAAENSSGSHGNIFESIIDGNTGGDNSNPSDPNDINKMVNNSSLMKEHKAVQDLVNSSPQLLESDSLQDLANPKDTFPSSSKEGNDALETHSSDHSQEAISEIDSKEESENDSKEESENSEHVLPVQLGNEQHHVHVLFKGKEIKTEVHSNVKDLEDIIDHIVGQGVHRSDLTPTLAGYRRASNLYLRAFRRNNLNMKRRNNARDNSLIRGQNPRLGRIFKGICQIERRHLQAGRTSLSLLRNIVNQEAKYAIDELWHEYQDILSEFLSPRSLLSKEHRVENGLNVNDYFTGDTIADAIPIIWYKDLSDYPSIQQADGSIRTMTQGANIGGGITISSNWPLGPFRKVAHNSNRSNQQYYNILINNTTNVGVIETGGILNTNPMGESPGQGYDGDHVQDLGFSGVDTNTNYWPLEAGINRRGFNGYNSGYLIHYRQGNQIKKKAIGGLIGKYFRIKGYMPNTPGLNKPNESGSAKAGTTQL